MLLYFVYCTYPVPSENLPGWKGGHDWWGQNAEQPAAQFAVQQAGAGQLAVPARPAVQPPARPALQPTAWSAVHQPAWSAVHQPARSAVQPSAQLAVHPSAQLAVHPSAQPAVQFRRR
jgi:hypothetical protein